MRKKLFQQVALVPLLLLPAASLSAAGNTGEAASPPVPKTPPVQTPATPPAVSTDGAQVFPRAFWRRPTAEDKILHAERREWREGTELIRWQWFLVVEPSPALRKHLLEDNPFGLAKLPPPLPPQPSAPAWFAFPADQVEAYQSRSGEMRLYFKKDTGLLYATSSGGGFQRPRTPPPTPVPESPPSTGRLPSHPPPQTSPIPSQP